MKGRGKGAREEGGLQEKESPLTGGGGKALKNVKEPCQKVKKRRRRWKRAVSPTGRGEAFTTARGYPRTGEESKGFGGSQRRVELELLGGYFYWGGLLMRRWAQKKQGYRNNWGKCLRPVKKDVSGSDKGGTLGGGLFLTWGEGKSSEKRGKDICGCA